ncbi:MAG: DinB family protein [Chitinophagaceae bacterium]|nr:DinB family protein [Chitinophagaceae bacterium]
MKKLAFFVIPAFLFLAFTFPKNSITDKERKDATDLLSKTEQGVFDVVKGLSDAQLKYKPAPDRWSPEECVKHIAVTEQALWQMVEGTLKQPANPEKRSEIKSTDEQVVNMIEDRSHKVKTAEKFEPQNTSFKTLDEALASFKSNREKLIEYVKATNDDLRNHVATLPPGSFDCYQMILFIGAHSNRHTQQINEVKADPGYPKN